MEAYHMSEEERNKLGSMQTKAVLNTDALFSDTTENYCAKTSEGMLRVLFRAARNNIDAVCLVCNGQKTLLAKKYTKGLFDYYETEICSEEKRLQYYFEIELNKEYYYYNQLGVSKNIQEWFSFYVNLEFQTPDWAKGAVMYQIFVDRFYNGDESNDVVDREYYYLNDYSVKVTDWYKFPAKMGIREFYGGDLKGVLDKLDYLQDLGIDVIYLNPIFVSPSNHKYDIQDYDYVDPHYGVIVKDGGDPLPEGQKDNIYASKHIQRVTDKENLEASNAFFAQVVEEIHRRGMKIILDGVFNHCGSFNKWMDRERLYEGKEGYAPGGYISKESPYGSFFQFKENKWPYNKAYDGWWGHETLPKLNYENSPVLCEYIMKIARKWVSPPFCVDGWRLDVAADLGHSMEYNHKFWQEFRREVKEANPNSIILAEHYGEASDWLQGNEWDTVMNYDAFMEPLTWFLTGMEKHSDYCNMGLYGNSENLIASLKQHMATFQYQSLATAMNELSNHDHSRFLTRTNHVAGRVENIGAQAASEGVNKGVFREAVIFQMTWIGAPTIYYGDEAGVCGFTDPDNRRTYPWGHEDFELIHFHKEMIRIHKENPAILKGSTSFLKADYNMIGFGRFTEEQQIVVVLNNNNHTNVVSVPVWQINLDRECQLQQIMISDANGYSSEIKYHSVINGMLNLELPATSGIVLRSIHNGEE